MTLRWTPPTTDGGASITGYAVEKKDTASKSSTWTSAGSTADTSLTVSRLTEGHSYMFRVFAENECGAGEPATTAKSVKAKLPYRK